MNAPTQEAGMTIADTWDTFKEYKQIQTVYEGSTYNLTGKTMVHNFVHNCRDSVYIQYRYDSEKNNPTNDHKWQPDQLANAIEAFFSDGIYKVYCKNNSGTKHQPTLPATNPRPVPRVKGGNANTGGTTHSQSLATQGRQGHQLPP
jgi:hypothetical protein